MEVSFENQREQVFLIRKKVERYYPDNEGIPVIEFWFGDKHYHLWYFDRDEVKLRDNTYNSLLEESQLQVGLITQVDTYDSKSALHFKKVLEEVSNNIMDFMLTNASFSNYTGLEKACKLINNELKKLEEET